jgi:hypothetical protein
MRHILPVIAFLFLGSLAFAQEITGPQPTLPQSALTIDTGERYLRFVVEVADSPYEHQRGLMFRREVPPNEGMLFDFESDFEGAFWMRNTLIPLDMLFIRSDGTIHRIAANTVPLSDVPVPSFGPVRVVLEIAGGRAAELGIEAGDVVRHELLNNHPPRKRIENW